MARTVLGIDARKGGWVAITLQDGTFALADTDPSLKSLIDRHPDAAVIGVDMPIGLSPDGRRECDVLAQEMVGARRSSVFLTPTQAALDASSHKDATALSLRDTGRGISQQSWALGPKIREVAALAQQDSRIVEVHPEVSFCGLAGQQLAWSKKTWAGQAERQRLLAAVGIELPEDLGDASAVPPDDVFDASVAAWSADRYEQGVARSLPEGAKAGQRMVIWY